MHDPRVIPVYVATARRYAKRVISSKIVKWVHVRSDILRSLSSQLADPVFHLEYLKFLENGRKMKYSFCGGVPWLRYGAP
jgi:hypothetical protein